MKQFCKTCILKAYEQKSALPNTSISVQFIIKTKNKILEKIYSITELNLKSSKLPTT